MIQSLRRSCIFSHRKIWHVCINGVKTGKIQSATGQYRVIKNEAIKSKTVRLIFEDPPGESQNKIMPLKEALERAKMQKLDVVLVADAADPPVCRIENAGKVLMDKRRKEKETRARHSKMAIKEMIISAGIDQNDLGIKMKKVLGFLGGGHQVRIQVMPKKGQLRSNPGAMDETMLAVLDALEGHAGPIFKADNEPAYKQVFTVSPPPQK